MITKEPGIYQILNLKTLEFYIGSSVNLGNRRDSHFYQLRKNIHPNIHLQRAWNKYGEESFTFEVVELVEDKIKLIQREQYYFDTLKPYYNISKIAGNTLGTKRSKVFKKRHSDWQKNRYLSRNPEPVVQLSLKGNYITEYSSTATAARETGYKDIRNVCIGYLKTSGGYRWLYKKDYESGNYKLPSLGRPTKGKTILSLCKAVIQLDKETGELIAEFESVTLVMKKFGRKGDIYAVCQGRAKTSFGFKWMYKLEYEQLPNKAA